MELANPFAKNPLSRTDAVKLVVVPTEPVETHKPPGRPPSMVRGGGGIDQLLSSLGGGARRGRVVEQQVIYREEPQSGGLPVADGAGDAPPTRWGRSV